MTTRSAAASSAGASPPAIAITTLRSNASSTAETAAAKEDLKKRHLHEEEEEDQDEQDEHTEDEDVVLDEVDDPEDNENTQSSSLGVHDDDSNENGLLLTGGSSSTSLVPGTVTPGTIMPTSGKQVQLYDSKRMTRVSFNSWFEFDQYFETYMQETFQPFRMRSSCSVEAYRRNQQKVMNNNKNSRGRRIEFPDSAVHHHRIYMCTHAMKARCRGATTRPGQKYRGIGCIAKINVKISPSDNQSKYMVIVTDQVVTHNHPISREIYEAYPDVVLKNMRRSQMATSLVRQPAPKFEIPSQERKYEKVIALFANVAEALARLNDNEFDDQYNQLLKIYGSFTTSMANVDTTTVTTDAADV